MQVFRTRITERKYDTLRASEVQRVWRLAIEVLFITRQYRRAKRKPGHIGHENTPRTRDFQRFIVWGGLLSFVVLTVPRAHGSAGTAAGRPRTTQDDLGPTNSTRATQGDPGRSRPEIGKGESRCDRTLGLIAGRTSKRGQRGGGVQPRARLIRSHVCRATHREGRRGFERKAACIIKLIGCVIPRWRSHATWRGVARRYLPALLPPIHTLVASLISRGARRGGA